MKLQQIFWNKKSNVFTKEAKQTALSANDDKTIQQINSSKTYEYGTNKEIIYNNDSIKCNDIIKQYKKWLMMILEQKT